jgi:hypothetical protein
MVWSVIQRLFGSRTPRTDARRTSAPASVSSPGPTLHFCLNSNPDCGEPRPLGKFLFGCLRCEDKGKLLPWSEITNTPSPENLTDADIWTPGYVKCPTHLMRPLIPWCAECHRSIWRQAVGAPFPLIAGSGAGKTVYLATLAYAMQHSELTKTQAVNEVIDPTLRKTVRALWEKGIVPEKTPEGEGRKLGFLLGQNHNGDTRTLTALVDVPGEAIEKNVRQYLLGEANGGIYLLDPHSAQGHGGLEVGQLGQAASVDVFSPLFRIFEVLVKHDLPLDSKSTIEEALTDVGKKLQSRYPWSEHQPQALGREMQQVLSSHLIPLHDNVRTWLGASDGLIGNLKLLENELKSRGNFLTLLEDVHNQLQRACFDRILPNGYTLDYSLAIAVTKADLIAEWVRQDLLADARKTEDTLAALEVKKWKPILQAHSDRCESILKAPLGEGAFVDEAKRRFTNVGFFFISSLGRPTGIRIDADKKKLIKCISGDLERGVQGPIPAGTLLPLMWMRCLR